jgi:hypothetical protein
MQNVGTPRFYIDSGLYQQAIGAWTPEDDQKSLVQLNPSNIVQSPENPIKVPRISPIRYIAFLGHNGGQYYPTFDDDPVDGFTEVINLPESLNGVDYSGFSIGTFSDTESANDLIAGIIDEESTLGAVSIGNYYDMPISPNMNLTLSYEYDGIKNVQTKGGSTLSNASYTKPADWGNRGAWQLGEVSNLRSGRRVWNLSFHFLADSDIMPNLGVQNYEEDIHGNLVNTEDILSGSDFFSVVWNQTMGYLPFLFNPNGGGESPNNSPDQFAICRFDMKSLKYSQISYNTYNMSLKIRESW